MDTIASSLAQNWQATRMATTSGGNLVMNITKTGYVVFLCLLCGEV